MTTIEIPDYITQPKSLTDMTRATADLLEHAEDSNLPVPGHVHLYPGGQGAQLGFRDHPDTFRALAQWAERFGGTVTGEPYTNDDGRESVHCQVRFTHLGVNVEAYAFITADQTSGT
jgi:hypothetical protein